MKKKPVYQSQKGNFFFQKSSVALIIIVSDLRNRMALSDFKNSEYFRSYG